MSGTTTLFNVPANTLRPGPRLVIVQDSDGMTTGNMDFTCRKYDIGSPAVQAKLAKGTALLTLYPQAGTDFDFLYLDSWTSTDDPGGITTVSCVFKGVQSGGGDFGFDSSSVVYTRNNSLQDAPIFRHPVFLEQVTGSTRTTIKLGSTGDAYRVSGGSYEIRRTGNDDVIETITDTDMQWWWDWIVEQGNDTFLEPHSEWTKSCSTVGKLTAAKLAKFGKIDTPPGDPAAPAGQNWLYTGATETITVTGDNANSYSQTWTSGNWEETRVYDYTP